MQFVPFGNLMLAWNTFKLIVIHQKILPIFAGAALPVVTGMFQSA
jgi:hypothetical protein